MMRYLLFFFLSFSITGLYAQVTSVGIIGPATPIGDWDTDVDMVQSPTDTAVWTLTTTLSVGELKFRANDGWDINWGSMDFPTGIGDQGGDNIPVFAGDYIITFNHVTGEYSFDVQSDIGLIGTATPIGDWDTDVNMFKDPEDSTKFFLRVNLSEGVCKWRKDDDWAVNWGNDNSDFPSGIAALNEGDITITKAGRYYIDFDTLTGAYNFEEEIDYTTVGVIGTASSDGLWTTADTLSPSSEAGVWTENLQLNDGHVQFRANNDESLTWGSSDFPTGDAILGSMDSIPITAGLYQVTFIPESGYFEFSEVVEYETMGIIGDATEFGDWETEVPMERSATNPHEWSTRVELADGEAKFRANMDWGISWGSSDGLAGRAELNGTTNFTITGGDYVVNFNSLTRFYSFEAVVEYDTLGLIGLSGPNADWETDVFMTKSEEDFNVWTLASATLSTADPAISDNGIKFRADANWAVNWGAADFPEGTGTQDGPNILCVAGTYGVTFNSLTGEYVFGGVITNTDDIIDPSSIKLFPNPSYDMIQLDLSSVQDMGPELRVSIYNMNGQLVRSYNDRYKNLMDVDVSSLQSGNYLIQITADGYIIGKRFAVFK